MHSETLPMFMIRLIGRRRAALPLWIGVLTIGVLTGCQSTVPPAPTTIPTVVTPTITLTITLTPTISVTPAPIVSTGTFRPMNTATGALPQKVTALIPTITATSKPFCITAQDGDTVISLLSRGGYGDTSAAGAFRQLNNMPPDSNVIVVGQSYCIPARTPTPTAPGHELTQTAQAPILPTSGPTAQAIEYIVKSDDTALSIEINTGIALSTICAMNPLQSDGSGLNCAGCVVNAPIFQSKCRPIIHADQHLKIPGPTVTPSLTPTLSGSETATPTLAYRAPAILSPADKANVTGQIVLEWVSSGVLAKGQSYLILLTIVGVNGENRNIQYTVNEDSFPIPDADLPTASGTYTFYWQLSIVRTEKDGSLTIISGKSAPASFTWTR